MRQIVALARTTLRNIIGTMTLKDANSERVIINNALYNNPAGKTKNWGLEIVRTELKEINPPADVQETMNKVVKASNERVAAIDFATARETQADGERRAAIKVAEGQRQAAILQAEGQKQAKILIAEGDAQAIKLVNESADLYCSLLNTPTVRLRDGVLPASPLLSSTRQGNEVESVNTPTVRACLKKKFD